MRKSIIIFILLFLFLASPAWATTTNVNCSSSSTVATALTNASSGDTIQCTDGVWGSGTVTLPNTKNITINGGGFTLTAGQLAIQGSATYQSRVTNFIFNGEDETALDASPYCVTTTNSSSGCSWAASAQTTITFASAGAQTGYAWCKDAAGNIGNDSDTVTITLPTSKVSIGSGAAFKTGSGAKVTIQ